METQIKTKYTIWKFKIPAQNSFELKLPEYARILSIKTQRGTPQLWVLVNPDNKMVTRKFEVFGTGYPVSQDSFNGTFIGTFFLDEDNLIFHVFELLPDIKTR